jgi:hypothetical protein
MVVNFIIGRRYSSKCYSKFNFPLTVIQKISDEECHLAGKMPETGGERIDGLIAWWLF